MDSGRITNSMVMGYRKYRNIYIHIEVYILLCNCIMTIIIGVYTLYMLCFIINKVVV